MSYVEEAKSRAERRKSKWNLLLIPLVVISIAVLWSVFHGVIEQVHASFYPQQNFIDTPNGIGAILASVALIFGLIPVALLFANFVVFLIPPARRALDLEANGYTGASFVQSQKALMKLAVIIIPISLGLAFLGAYLPWSG